MDSETSKTTLGGSMKIAVDRLTSELPYLPVFGLTFWQLWNVIAFSGSFWLHSSNSFYFAQELIMTHLLSCCATLLLFFFFAKRIQRIVLSLPVVFVGAFIATLGTLFLYIAREDYLASQTLFDIGCVCTGFGTTILYLKGFSALTRLHPKRTLSLIAMIIVVSTLTYFMLCSIPTSISVVIFILLPLLGALLYALPSKDLLEQKATPKKMHLSKKVILLVIFIMLSSAAFELCRAHITISLAPSVMITNTQISNFVLVPVLLALAAYALIKPEQKQSYSRIVAIAFIALLVILVVSIMLYDNKIESMGILVSIANTLFNLVVWSILCYVTYAAKSTDLRVVALGNTALAMGTMLSSLVAMRLYEQTLSEETVKYIILLVAVVIIILMVFIFAEHHLDSLLVPVPTEKRTGENDAAPAGERRWPGLCERFGKANNLTEREIAVLIEHTSGRSVEEIAAQNVISVYTVRSHIRSIHTKLNVHSKNELVSLIKDFRSTEDGE